MKDLEVFLSPKSMVLASENGRVWKSCQDVAGFPQDIAMSIGKVVAI
jgi:hypothetical protein